MQSSHPATIAAIAVLVYLLATVIHEGIGHGGICALTGGSVRAITSVHCDCDYRELSRTRRRMVEAAGTIANLLFGAVFAAALLSAPAVSPTVRYFLWLSAMVNLFQAGGYLIVAPFAGFGDWGAFLEGISGRLVWKLGLTAAGIAISVTALHFGLEQIAPLCGFANPLRSRQAWLLTALPYATGALFSCSIALLNPVDKLLVVTSAGAATIGGTSWLLWIGYLTGVLDPRTELSPTPIEPSPALMTPISSVREFGYISRTRITPPADQRMGPIIPQARRGNVALAADMGRVPKRLGSHTVRWSTASWSNQ